MIIYQNIKQFKEKLSNLLAYWRTPLRPFQATFSKKIEKPVKGFSLFMEWSE